MSADLRAPVVSIVVATGTRNGNRAACLAAAAVQMSDGRVEVLESPIAAGGAGAAWNAGAARAAGPILLFVADDVIPAEHMVTAHLAALDGHPADLTAGPTSPSAGVTGLARYYGEHAGAESAFAACCGRTLGMSRHRFHEVGGFATGLPWGAEAELAFRVTAGGGRVVHLSGTTGVRRLPRGYRDIAALLACEGRGTVALYRREPRLLPFLKLADFAGASESALALRGMLMALGAPVVPLGMVGALIQALMRNAERRDAWFRFLTSYLFWRGVRDAAGGDLWRRLSRGPVILMYHAVGASGERPGCYVVPARRFARQMRWLKLAGYRVLGLDELLRYRREHRLPPARAVAITFDDGYRDNWTLATPVLRRFDFTATCFLVTSRLGATNDWDAAGELAGRPLLSVDDVRRMLAAGMTIGGHTRTHPALPELAAEQVREELEGARCDLERELAVAAPTFAYPYGRLDAGVRDAVEQAGYAGACCSRSGVNDPVVPPFLLRRLEVRGTDSLLQFVRAVRRGRARRRGSAR